MLTRTRLLVLAVIILAGTSGWLGYVIATPAPSIGATIEPGSLRTHCLYDVYQDGGTTLAKNCRTGANTYSGTSQSVLQSALTDAGGIGSLIYVEDGTYTITAKLLMSSSTILWGLGDNTVFFAATNLNTNMLENINCASSGNQNVEIHDITFDGNQANQAAGTYGAIHFCGVTDFRIEGVHVQNTKDKGIYLQGIGSQIPCLRGKILNNIVKNSVGFSYAIYCSETTVIGNIVYTNTNIAADDFNIGCANGYCTYSGNIVDHSGGGTNDCFALGGVMNSSFTANTCIGVANGYRIYGPSSNDNNVFSTSTITGLGTNGFYGISLNTNGSNNTAIGNTLMNFRDASTGYGILLDGFKNRAIGNNVAFDNRVPLVISNYTDVAYMNYGFNPLGKFANPPFSTGNVKFIQPYQGAVSAPVASTNYLVASIDIYITSTGGTGVSITIQDPLGNTMASGLATLTIQSLPVGWKINWGAFSVAPTVTIVGN